MPCSFCNKANADEVFMAETRDGKKICSDCQQIFHFCGVCGSIAVDTNADNQLHYEEECFK